MGTFIIWGLAAFVGLSIIAFILVKRVPHGWVLFRTGVILKFLPALDKYPVVKLRHSVEDYIVKKLPSIRKSLPVSSISELEIPTRHGPINARLFGGHKNPASHLIVFIHGGGWCIGSANTHEEACRRLVVETGLPLISLEYSLAPESKFPIAHDECLDATSWIVDNMMSFLNQDAPLVLIGDSAGGNLILTSLYESSLEVQKRIKKIVPVYPVTDNYQIYQSAHDFADGYYLTKKSMEQFTEGLLSDPKEKTDIRLSPIKYPVFEHFPETFLITAEFDPLRDQGEAYAEKLRDDGVKVTRKRYKGTIHAFFGVRDFGWQSVEVIKDVRRFIDGEPIPESL